MAITSQPVNSEIIQKYQNLAGKDVFQAIQSASATTGVDFSYLLEQAQAESNFDADVTAKTSSATGLYQFIEQTWLQMVAKHGYKHGLGQYGQQISMNEQTGRASVSDPAMEQKILDLRKDPEIASKMAAEFARDNQQYLERKTDREVGSTEMYLAHFLGAGSAGRFINAQDHNSQQPAAKLFPAAARANKAVFYNRDGSSRTLDQVYAFFDKKFSDGPAHIPAQPPIPSKDTANPTYLAMNTIAPGSTMPDMPLYTEQAQADVKNTDGTDGASRDIRHQKSYMQASTRREFRALSRIDVMLMSDMIQQWTNEDASRAYRESVPSAFGVV